MTKKLLHLNANFWKELGKDNFSVEILLTRVASIFSTRLSAIPFGGTWISKSTFAKVWNFRKVYKKTIRTQKMVSEPGFEFTNSLHS